MKALNKSVHFIRCIKPNKPKDHSIFDSGMINRQLAYDGVHQAVLVRKQGYPYRLDFDFFVNRYWPLISTAKRREFIKYHDSKSKVEAYLDELEHISVMVYLYLRNLDTVNYLLKNPITLGLKGTVMLLEIEPPVKLKGLCAVNTITLL